MKGETDRDYVNDMIALPKQLQGKPNSLRLATRLVEYDPWIRQRSLKKAEATAVAISRGSSPRPKGEPQVMMHAEYVRAVARLRCTIQSE